MPLGSSLVSLFSCAQGGVDPYEVPKALGIFTSFENKSTMETGDIVTRIIKNRLEFEERNRKKELKENAIFEADQARKALAAASAGS